MRHKVLIAMLAACVLFAAGASAQQPEPPQPESQQPDAQRMAQARRAAELATTMLDSARQSCAQANARPGMTAAQIDMAIHDANAWIDAHLHGPGDVPAARARLATLQAQIGDLETTPSLDLQQTLAMLAGIEGKVDEQLQRRAFTLALDHAIMDGHDGDSPQTAFVPCLVGNEYHFSQVVLQAAAVDEQALVASGGRKYDVLTLRGRDGAQRKAYFDITDIFGAPER